MTSRHPRNDNARRQPGGDRKAEDSNPKSSGNSAEAQRARLLERLQHGPITTITARRELDILAPAPRVLELRRQGHNISTVWVTQYTDAGKPHRVALYCLAGGAHG